MPTLILILLTVLASLVIGITDSDSSILIHTDDTVLFGQINVKGLLDFTNSEESKVSSHGGAGLNLHGVYFHSAPESTANNQTVMQATPTNGMTKKLRSRRMTPPATLPVMPPVTTCYPSVCESDSGVIYSDNAHLSFYFSQTCQWIQANIGTDWTAWKVRDTSLISPRKHKLTVWAGSRECMVQQCRVSGPRWTLRVMLVMDRRHCRLARRSFR